MAASLAFGRADMSSGSTTAVTAAGTAAATATAISSMVNIVTTATGESGVKLPQNHAQGSPIIAISTASTVAILVYPPPTAGKINSTTAAFSVAQNKPVVFFAHPNGIDYTAIIIASRTARPRDQCGARGGSPTA